MGYIRAHGPSITTIIVNLSTITVGIAIAWSSTTVADLMEPIVDRKRNPLGRNITIVEGSLIASVMTIGAFLGPFPAAFQAQRWGRKPSILTGCIAFIIAFSVNIIARDVWHIYVGRFFQGVGVAYVTTVVTIYVGEIATSRDRGTLGSLLQVFLSLGIVFMNVVASYFDYVIVNMMCLIFPLLSGILFLFFPESPYFYLSVNDTPRAVEALMFFRNTKKYEDVKNEMREITRAVRQRSEDTSNLSQKLFRVKGNRRALLVCLGLIFFQQFSGVNAILFYTKTIMAKAGVEDPDMGVIYVSVMMFVTAVFVPILSACGFGRKWMLSISAIGMAITNFVLGTYYFVTQHEIFDVTNYTWVPLAMLLTYPLFYSIGYGPLPWVLLGEMLNDSIKFVASPLASSLCWALAFLISILFPIFDHLFGASIAFWTFGGLCVLAFLFTVAIVIETKGLSLYQIQMILNNVKTETETGKPEAGKAEAGKTEAGKAEAGKPEAGKPEAGNLEAVKP